MNMTQINKRIIASLKYITVLACATIAISSCQREEFRIKSGETIRFTATTSGSSLASTKTEYSGEFNTDNTKERIDWQVGDLIRIYCAEASKPESKFADYFIDQEPTSAGAVSGSSVSLMDSQTATGLRWGATDKDHVFYAVYPSPATAGCGDGSIGDDTMTGVISETQKPLKLSTGSNPDFTAVPNLNSEYMVATNTIAAGSFESSSSVGSEDVFLTFKPIVTAIEFTIKNGFKNDGDLNIKEVQLISASHPIAGAFAADLTDLNAEGSAYPKCTSSSTQKTVKMDFTAIPDYDYSGNAEISGSKKYLKIAKDKTLRFTFFLMPGYNGTTPVDVDDLTFKIVKADGSWISTKLAYNDAAKAGVKFPCHKKSYVQGLLVPEGAQWIVKYDPTVQSWDTDTDDINPMPETEDAPFVTSWDTGIDEELSLKPEHVKWIDLGLPSGKLWADRNVDANAEYEVGSYYSWGETELWYTAIEGNTVTMKPEYSQFNWSEYAAKSNMKSILSNLTGTYAIYDVARLLYGNDCHIPSDNEFRELANNCYWRYVSSYDGQSVEGYMIFKAKNDADKGKYTLKNPVYVPAATYSKSDTHIFLPFSGFITAKTVRSGNIDGGDPGKTAGYYLTSTTGQVALTDSHATHAGFERFAVGTSSPTIATVPRHAGMPVRAVKQKQKTVEYVEIGGLKWATMNLGATKPEEPGLYFAWGDVAGQYAATTGTGAFTKSYEWANTPFNNGKTLAQNTWFSNNQSLWITDDATLKPDYDAASVLIGGGWRMPTKEDLNNLLSNTNQVKVTDYNGSGVGWICTSKTDDTKAIFLPATGYGSGTDLTSSGWGCYWSSTLTVTNKGNAERLTLGETVTGNNARWQGRCIRPVHD
ncbi:MAG: hypothetical protein KBS53_04370 [Bacteroidales bacterium]|nr:hypothetical protein [Candidatus Hennigimonas equi]